jgi:hypothetical protein
MKRLFILIAVALLPIGNLSLKAQAYKGLNIAGAEYNTRSSSRGINVDLIEPQSDGSYLVKLNNTNNNDPYDGVSYITSYSFEWYLSYCGKRVSDYYNSTIRCKKNETKYVYAWPGKVPKGKERYVTVQFGRESGEIKKDRRDDY